MSKINEILQPVEEDLEVLLKDLRELIGADHPILQAAAEHLFSAGGKRLRPAIVFLVSKGISPNGMLTEKHKKLAQITEMIHTASLVHDDVVDEASMRRGVQTVHNRFNHKVAVLAGDFLFAQASWHLANLNNLEVVKLLSRVIMDLAEGEIKQGLYKYDSDQSLDIYLEKSFCKTASLLANSVKAAGVLTGQENDKLELLYSFGRKLGLAFQVVDDILDFTSSDEQLGKPSAIDLASGYLTAPALFAIKESSELSSLIKRQFNQTNDLDKAYEIILSTNAIKLSRELAEKFAFEARDSIEWMKPSIFKDSLIKLPEYVLSRIS